MKVYDKEMYSKQENLKSIVIIIAVFLLGFFAGYMAHSYTVPQKVENNTNSTYVDQNK